MMNTNQKKVLAELLSPGSRTIPEVAAAVGLGERTVYAYLQDPEFQRELNAGLDRAITQASIQLANLSSRAVKVFEYLLRSEGVSDTNRRLAADAVLNHLVKLITEREFLDRLEALERKVL